MTRAIALAGLASGVGKTMITLGFLEALRQRGVTVAAAKSGPDYIDPQWHALATGRPSATLDAFAMAPETLRARAAEAADGADLLVIEGAMGLFDGADDGRPFGPGATADVAAALDAPVALILDVAGQGQSAAAAALGTKTLRDDVALAGVILNRVRSSRHGEIAARALSGIGVRTLARVAATQGVRAPSRHLGLIQPEELAEAAAIRAAAAALFDDAAVEALTDAARPLDAAHDAPPRLAPLGSRVAVAQDAAFRFAYPHMLQDWRAQGAEIIPFSPLADEAPRRDCDAVFLPGGYPELHAERLAAADRFRAGVRASVDRGARVYGECGGYMVLGQTIIGPDDQGQPMLGLLPITTRFGGGRPTLGYRRLSLRPDTPLSLWAGALAGHEFHYAAEATGSSAALFDAEDAAGRALGPVGAVMGRVCGSFAHVVDRRAANARATKPC